ncbi:hypothetical protein EW146_g4148 [Bondarzewia mesenterica]|uniref:Enoyl reductase (ER) domain-containing protein n=1 Tax=Bondarzewia mesenterica TaxID=1095465 RepID=A0A4S4LXK1_9AGAM|nr:hypothetical protein EW146_g4148 [Bondarzewia mesenterica]
MPSKLPPTTRTLIIQRAVEERKPVYHDVKVVERPIAVLKKGEVLVKIGAAAFNHRDLWIRKGQYPGIVFGSSFGADGAGTVVASADDADPLLNQRVFLVPMRGWESDPDAPETDPDHLDDVHVAAWPLGGVTAWRAVMVNAEVDKGQNILITGAGGGVALVAIQLCIAKGANVYVSSGSEDKIAKAIALGAKGGVNYKHADWPTLLQKLLQRDGQSSLDAVIDSSGGDIARQTGKILKQGGRIVCYGMTAAPQIAFSMREVLKNQRLIGKSSLPPSPFPSICHSPTSPCTATRSTMGSHKDLVDATHFLTAHRIVPIVSCVLDGLAHAEEGFALLEQGHHFGKVVVRISDAGSRTAKLPRLFNAHAYLWEDAFRRVWDLSGDELGCDFPCNNSSDRDRDRIQSICYQPPTSKVPSTLRMSLLSLLLDGFASIRMLIESPSPNACH